MMFTMQTISSLYSDSIKKKLEDIFLRKTDKVISLLTYIDGQILAQFDKYDSRRYLLN